jgi:hypothetical protein
MAVGARGYCSSAVRSGIGDHGEVARQDQYWFRAKRYGWGWGRPLTWEGWTVLAGYLALVLAPLAMGESGAGLSVAAAVIGAPLLLLVCYRKGEPPKWRWGGD